MDTCFHCGIDFENEKSARQKIQIVLVDQDIVTSLDFHPGCFYEIAGTEYYDELLERRNKEILFREERKFNINKGYNKHIIPDKIGHSGAFLPPPPNASITVACEDCGAPALVQYCEKCVAKRVTQW